MDKKQQHSPISRRAFVGSISAKAAAAGALGVVAAQEVVRASGETDANPQSPRDAKAGEVSTPKFRPPYIYRDYYPEYYEEYPDCGYKGGVAYAGLALLIARACGRLRGESKGDDQEDSAEG